MNCHPYLDSCEINCNSRFIVKFYLQEKNNNKKILVELILGNLEEKEYRRNWLEKEKKIIIENGKRLKIATFLSSIKWIFFFEKTQ